MRRKHLLSIASTLALASLLCSSVAAQRQGENWLREAELIGGSGVAVKGRYVRTFPSNAWQPWATPPVWLEFTREGQTRTVRGTIPVLRSDSEQAVEVLRRCLPDGGRVAVRNTFGKESPRVQVRFLASSRVTRAHHIAIELVRACREALDEIEPRAVARIDTTGVIREESFECEKTLVVRTVECESIEVKELPAAVARVGTHVRLVGIRKGGSPRFLYHGAGNHWTGHVKASQVTAIAPLPKLGIALDRKRWVDACRSRARELIVGDEHRALRLRHPLAHGFEEFTGPGHSVCPLCQRALEKDDLFADKVGGRVAATLACCVREQVFFLGRDGADHGPFRSSATYKENR